MFNDDGTDPNSLTNGKYELVDFTGRISTDSVQITTARTKSFDKAIVRRSLIYEIKNLTSPPVTLKINGKNLPIVRYANEFTNNAAYYDLENKELKIRCDWECKDPLVISLTRDGLAVITATEPPTQENILTVFPNPGFSQNPLSIKIKFIESGVYSLEVFNNAGTIVADKYLGKQQKGSIMDFALDVQKLRGAYIFKLKNERDKIQTKTVVIE